jgi:hydroxymethylpyrimidine/phosphomethylpyrimidine kinase
MGRVRPVAMTIAGSDSGGGAGIAADLKTFAAAGVHGTLAITSVTAQNTVAVTGIYDLPPEAVRRQILAVHEDMGIDAAKTGMLSSAPIVRAVAEVASQLGLTLVVDPVMVSKSGAALLREDAVEALARELVPRAKVVTPNAPEAERLTGIRVRDLAGARAAAEHIVEQLGAEAAVVKGGHLGGPESVDVLYHAGRHVELRSPRIESRTTHGTGCSFSAAIAAGLARGMGIEDSVDFAKRLVTDAIRYGLELGAGHGPVNPSSWVDVPAERFRALQDVRLALRVLVENEFFVSRVVPESSMNVAAALPAPYASGPGDVAAIAGGIGRFGRRLVARGEVEFGAAEQLAAALLGVSERFPEVRGAAIVASGEEVSRAMESLGFRALPSGGRGAALGRRDLGIAVSEALRGESAPPDAVVDGGGPGLEPLTIVFGRSAVEAASKVAAIGKAIAGAGTPSADRGRGASGSGATRVERPAYSRAHPTFKAPGRGDPRVGGPGSEYLEFWTRSGPVLYRPASLPELRSADALMLDCDGTIVDVRRSYLEAAVETARILAALSGRRLPPRPALAGLVPALKESGLLNNDWDTAAALYAAWAMHVDGGVPLEDAALGAASAGIDGIYEAAARAGGLDLGRCPGPPPGCRVSAVFDSIYYGAALYREIYSADPPVPLDRGLMEDESLIVGPADLRALAAHAGGAVAIVTGRPKSAVRGPLGELLRSVAGGRVVHAGESGHPKPDPTPLLLAASALGSRSPIYVGDSPEDLMMAEASRGLGLRTSFVGVYGASLDPARSIGWFASRGAAAIAPSPAELGLLIYRGAADGPPEGRLLRGHAPQEGLRLPGIPPGPGPEVRHRQVVAHRPGHLQEREDHGVEEEPGPQQGLRLPPEHVRLHLLVHLAAEDPPDALDGPPDVGELARRPRAQDPQRPRAPDRVRGPRGGPRRGDLRRHQEGVGLHGPVPRLPGARRAQGAGRPLRRPQEAAPGDDPEDLPPPGRPPRPQGRRLHARVLQDHHVGELLAGRGPHPHHPHREPAGADDLLAPLPREHHHVHGAPLLGGLLGGAAHKHRRSVPRPPLREGAPDPFLQHPGQSLYIVTRVKNLGYKTV